MSCKFCDCLPCMCGKNAYPGTPKGEKYDRELKELSPMDKDIADYMKDYYAQEWTP